MSRVLLLIMLASLYVLGIHALDTKAMALEQHVAGLYEATNNPDALLTTASK